MSEPQRLPFIPAWLDELGLSPTHYRVYCHLWRRGNCHSTAATIAGICRIKRNTAFDALAALEAAGLVRRTARPGRTTLIEPVPIGAPGSVPLSDPCPSGHRLPAHPVPEAVRLPDPSGHHVATEAAPETARPPVPETVHQPCPSGHHEGISLEGSPPEGKKEDRPLAPLPVDRVKDELRKVFPDAPRHMTGAEQHDLFSSLAVLDEFTPEDWLASRAWMICPDRVRGRKLWPRDRAEFVQNAGQAIEAIRPWWKTGGRAWWNQRPGQPAKQSAPGPPEDEGETLDLGPEALQFFKSAAGKTTSPKPLQVPATRPPLGGRPAAPTREIGA